MYLKTEDYCDYELCETIAKKGYAKGSPYCIVKFVDDYVYDDDPSHAESHWKGEIRIYDIYYNNREKHEQMFEMPLLYEVCKWLMEEKGFFISVSYNTFNKKYNYTIFELDVDMSMSVPVSCFEKYTDCLQEAIKQTLKYLKDEN